MKTLPDDFLIDTEKLEQTYKEALTACFEQDKKYVRSVVEDMFLTTANELYNTYPDVIKKENGISRVINSEIIIPARKIQVFGRVRVDKKWNPVVTQKYLQMQG